MRLNVIIFTVISVLALMCSSKHGEQDTLNYSTLNYDTNSIHIFKWDTAKFSSNNSDPLPLSQRDLFIVDSFLKDAIDSFNIKFSSGLYHAFEEKVPIDSFIIKKDVYKYQFFPYKDVNGERIVDIIGFTRNFTRWKTDRYTGGMHYGMHKLRLSVNLSRKFRTNLYSGDFG